MTENPDGLSVVMITRNSERYLGTVLRSLKSVANEIILVDTGSDDATLDISRKYGCRVFEIPWEDDFSKAKNFVIEQARYNWVLNVDSDEVLYGKNARDILLDALSCRDIPAYIVWIENLFDGGRVDQAR